MYCLVGWLVPAVVDYGLVGDDSACMNQYLNCRVGFIEWVMCQLWWYLTLDYNL